MEILLETGTRAYSEAAPGTKIIAWAAAGLIVCSVSAALLIGDIGFQGDDWWQFSWPYWYSFPYSVWEYIKESRRPIEGLYTVLAFETFGLNRIWYNFSALLLSAGSCLLMGACLKKAFPGRDSLVALAALFAFVLTPLSNLLYLFHTDNSRLSVLLFWASVWAFQRWAGVSLSWHGLIFPVLLYCLATLTYENTTFLIFAVPLFVWPIHTRDRKESATVQGDKPNRSESRCGSLGEGGDGLPLHPQRAHHAEAWKPGEATHELSDRSFLLRVSVGVMAGFAVFLLARFELFSGGAVRHSSLVPPLSLAWKYISNLALFCVTPFWNFSGDRPAWAWGCLVALITCGLLFRSARGDSANGEKPVSWDRSSLYVALLGLAVLVLGMLPYLMAGYDSSLGFTSQSRIYSSAAYGVAILLALLFTASTNKKIRPVFKIAAVFVIALMAVFLMDLRKNWKEAAEKRNQLCVSLLEQVPDVAEGTTFLLLDLQWYLSDNSAQSAVVFQGVDGLGEFVRMLYNKRNLYAYFLYPNEQVVDHKEGRIASVSPEGLVARGSAIRPPIPLDTLLILKRQGPKLVLLDSICAADARAAINWKGVNVISSNRKLILPTRGKNQPARLICPR